MPALARAEGYPDRLDRAREYYEFATDDERAKYEAAAWVEGGSHILNQGNYTRNGQVLSDFQAGTTFIAIVATALELSKKEEQAIFIQLDKGTYTVDASQTPLLIDTLKKTLPIFLAR